jgi:hypothetical protein
VSAAAAAGSAQATAEHGEEEQQLRQPESAASGSTFTTEFDLRDMSGVGAYGARCDDAKCSQLTWCGGTHPCWCFYQHIADMNTMADLLCLGIKPCCRYNAKRRHWRRTKLGI